MTIKSYAGWDRCVEIKSGDLRAYVTLDIGPRIIGLEHDSTSENLFFVKPETAGELGGEGYRSYGGHRLLIGPELFGHVNEADNESVLIEDDGWISTRVSPLGWQKSLRISPVVEGFLVEHRGKNVFATPKSVCPWTLTVVKSSGISFTPSQPFISHPVGIEAASSLVLWPYTDLSDPRYQFCSDGIGLRCENGAALTATKYGLWVPQCKAGYLTDTGYLFTKEWVQQVEPGIDWPDRGVNYEAFTRPGMLELESLGPMVTLEVGDSCIFKETWTLQKEQRNWHEIAKSWR